MYLMSNSYRFRTIKKKIVRQYSIDLDSDIDIQPEAGIMFENDMIS